MDEALKNAIDTVDAARQHKCELEGRLKQLNACLSQVSLTSERAREDIKECFSELQAKVIKEMQQKAKSLLDQVKHIERESLKPLEECKQILLDGIQESVSVIENGETLLHMEENNAANVKKLNKFTSSSSSLSLDSVPEVPSVTEVACVAFYFKEKNFVQSLCTSIKAYGEISKQAPVQVTDLEPLPGGMIVSWDETDGDETTDWIDNGNTVLYKLQYCQGKVSIVPSQSSSIHTKSHDFFQNAYIGKSLSCTVKKLLPNTAYTFRVSRCLLLGENHSKSLENWSPWSVYQDGITTLPGYEWSNVTDSEGYSILDKCRTALKRSNASQILYSKNNAYIVGYPITFRIDNEGKSQSLGDGFALMVKIDPTSHSIVKEGSVSVAADGRIFINGTESKTRFCNFTRNTTLRFTTQEIKENDSSDVTKIHKKSKASLTLQVTITMMDREAVFNWKIPVSSTATNASNKLCLSFAAAFKSQGWKFSVI